MLWSILKTSYYPEPHSHISVEVTVVLYLSNYSNKKALDHATDVDTSDLAAKKDFIALKAEVDKLDIDNIVNVSNKLNNLTTKKDELDIGKLRAVPVDKVK